ncbi:hypothetical protein HYH02_012783 [Chlamydomonas schloesseri]|uniref:Uncharacterized protein n=1 Tax=Chlamydomonas schloesseri TaxID=2026947 RepID=A0A835W104_9CHLO|nr:hypothetical protein HYH02_012783 [Chlamydomonas schloesseri]|eukprot:KAG2433079.1 hypothetical protein HYH02_012783 [Chlamydomonas schloesseri]
MSASKRQHGSSNNLHGADISSTNNATASASDTPRTGHAAASPLPPKAGSMDIHSNRSSFAAEGIPGGAKLAAARASGSARRSVDDPAAAAIGRLPSVPALEAVRGSQQARLSSIQAADVMGVGGDKPAGAAARPLAAAFDPLPGYSPPAGLAAHYPLLGALPPDTPVPLDVLSRLWRAGKAAEALEVARGLAAEGVLRLAALDDGSQWALPSPQHVAHAAAAWPGAVAAVHGQILDSYSKSGAVALDSLRDDGYIIQALSHHLVGSGRLEALRRLLMNPGWLEAKLHAYGVGAVVRDFRRYLQEAEAEPAAVAPGSASPGTAASSAAGEVKLLLQAFQLSLGAAMEHPTARMMREQMLARLMAVTAGGRLKEWYDEQTAKCAAEGMLAVNSRLLHLMPRSPSLAQAGGVQRMTLRGHSAPVTRVAIAPNCTEVVTISEDGSAQVWDMNIGDCVMQLARDAPLTAVGLTPDSASAVVAAADGTAAVWSLATGQVLHTLSGHTAKINALAIDKQGIRVVTASDDHTGRVWNLSDGSCEAVLRGHGGNAGVQGAVLDVAICADGTLAATVSDDFSCRVWDLDEDGEQLQVLEGHGGWVVSAAFVGTTHRLVTASHDGTAKIWDALKGRLLFTLSGHTGRLNRVSVDPGGSWVVTASDDTTARVWDCETGQLKQVLEGAHSAHVTDAAITRDCSKVITVAGDGSGAVWDLASGRQEALLEGHTGEVRAVVLTQRGRFAVTAGEDGTARVWDLAAEALVAPPCHAGRVTSLAALPDGQLVVSAGEDGCVFLWDPVEGVCLKRMAGHRVGVRFMRVSTDGALVLTGSGDRQISRWNWAEYSAAASVAGRRRSMERRELMLNTLTTAAGSVGGRSLGSLMPGGGTTSGGQLGSELGAGLDRGTNSTIATTRGGAHTPGTGRNSEEETLAALEGGFKPGAGPAAPPSVPNTASGAMPRAAAPEPASAAAAVQAAEATPAPATADSLSVLGSLPTFNGNANLGVGMGQSGLGAAAAAAAAAAGGGGGTPPLLPLAAVPFTRTSLLDLCAAVTADPLRASMPAQQGSRVKHMAFDAACTTAAVLLFDSTVSVWDVASGKCTAQLIKRGERDASRTHSGGVNAVYLTRDASTAVTISKDQTARIWDVPSASTRFVVEGHTDGLVAADISADEALLATAAYDKTVRVTRMATGAAVAVLDHPQPPTAVSFSPNCHYMAVSLEDHSVVVWDLVGRCCLPALDAHKAALAVLTWSPDSRFLLTGGADCTVRLWRAEDGRQQAFFMADSAITAACFAGCPVADIVVAGDSAGAVHFLDWAEELQG